jgi:hypothetical protein
MLLAMGSVYHLMRSAWLYQQALDLSVEIQAEAVLGISRITKELSESSFGTVHVYADPPGVVFASPRSVAEGSTIEYNLSGQLMWQSITCFYQDGDKVIRKRQSIPTVFTPPDSTATGLSTSVAARSVKDFQVEIINRYISVKLTTERQHAHRKFSVEMRGGTGPRN